MRKGDWKLIEYFEDGKLQLFNLKSDTAEQNELSKKYPYKLKELKNDLIQWCKGFNAPVHPFKKVVDTLQNKNEAPLNNL